MADRLRPVLADRLTPEPIPGLRLLTLDGNKLAPTHRRPAVTRAIPAPMPGQALVLREHATGLLTRVLPHPDAYDNERKLLADVLDGFGPGDGVVADCNVCTHLFLAGLVARGAHAVVRHHGSVGLHPVGPDGAAVPTPTGRVSESVVRYAETALEVRWVRVQLAAATRAGRLGGGGRVVPGPADDRDGVPGVGGGGAVGGRHAGVPARRVDGVRRGGGGVRGARGGAALRGAGGRRGGRTRCGRSWAGWGWRWRAGGGGRGRRGRRTGCGRGRRAWRSG